MAQITCPRGSSPYAPIAANNCSHKYSCTPISCFCCLWHAPQRAEPGARLAFDISRSSFLAFAWVPTLTTFSIDWRGGGCVCSAWARITTCARQGAASGPGQPELAPSPRLARPARSDCPRTLRPTRDVCALHLMTLPATCRTLARPARQKNHGGWDGWRVNCRNWLPGGHPGCQLLWIPAVLTLSSFLLASAVCLLATKALHCACWSRGAGSVKGDEVQAG